MNGRRKKVWKGRRNLERGFETSFLSVAAVAKSRNKIYLRVQKSVYNAKFIEKLLLESIGVVVGNLRV